jgi:hypothetical protein
MVPKFIQRLNHLNQLLEVYWFAAKRNCQHVMDEIPKFKTRGNHRRWLVARMPKRFAQEALSELRSRASSLRRRAEAKATTADGTAGSSHQVYFRIEQSLEPHHYFAYKPYSLAR